LAVITKDSIIFTHCFYSVDYSPIDLFQFEIQIP